MRQRLVLEHLCVWHRHLGEPNPLDGRVQVIEAGASDSADQLGLRSGSADAVMSVDARPLAADAPQALVEARRLLRPGGRGTVELDAAQSSRRELGRIRDRGARSSAGRP
jgi:hypothetical protein